MVATASLFAAAQVLYTDPSFHCTNTSCEISRTSSHGEHFAPHVGDVHLHVMQIGTLQVFQSCIEKVFPWQDDFYYALSAATHMQNVISKSKADEVHVHTS
jgi:hypothetical protein